MHDVVKVGENELLEGFELVCLGWRFAVEYDRCMSVEKRDDDSTCSHLAVWQCLVGNVVGQNYGSITQGGGDELVIDYRRVSRYAGR